MKTVTAASFKFTQLYTSILSTLILTSPFTVFAQDNTASPSNDRLEIEKIQVTATKRTSAVQDTAIAMSAFTGEMLDENGVTDVTDLAAFAPGVTFTQNSAAVIVSIRGVNSQDTNETGNPAVAIAQDSFYIERSESFSNAIYDMERVEVLRGPQGTLYGKNATGGVINFISNKPTSESEGYASVGIGNYGLISTQGMLNAPINEEINFRAAFMNQKHEGYRRNESPARSGDDADIQSARMHLSYAPIDNLNILLSAQWTELGGVGPTVQGVAIADWSDDAVPDFDKDGVEHSLPTQFLDQNYETYQLNVEYSTDFMNISYLFGLRDSDYEQLRDLDGTERADRYMNPHSIIQDLSHEIRFSSNTDGPFGWQLGANYFRETNDLYTTFQDWSVDNSPENLMTFDYAVRTESKAAFIHINYQLLENFELEAGVRGSKDNISRVGEQVVFGAFSELDEYADSSKTTYHLGANWHINEETLVYLKNSTGYKAGGYNNVPGVGTQAYDPETLSSWETGLKTQLLDNTLQLNATLFNYDYEDQQVKVLDPSGLSAIQNAGQSEINGIEVEFVYRITNYDRVDGSIVLLDAEYKEFCSVYSSDGDCTVDYAGYKLVQTPEKQFNLSYEHEFIFDNGSLVAKLQSHIESESYLGLENLGYQLKDSYTKTDFLLTYYQEDWSIQGYIRNIEDDAVINSAKKSGLFGTYNYSLSAPRTVGVKLKYQF